jgi:hypothetical protein
MADVRWFMKVKYREILRMHYHTHKYSFKEIADSVGNCLNSVKDVIARFEKLGLPIEEIDSLSDIDLKVLITGKDQNFLKANSNYMEPDYDYIKSQLIRGIKLSVLYFEYVQSCDVDKIPYKMSRFYELCSINIKNDETVMLINRNPGETLEVDWAGKTLKVYNQTDGTWKKAYIFVATFPCCGYSYVEAFLSEKMDNWIRAHVNAFNFFGGTCKMLVPDNLRTGVYKSDRYNPLINSTYKSLADHYGTAVAPARVRKPRDKSNVERAVLDVTTWVIIPLRLKIFYSLESLNEALRERLDILLNMIFKGNKKSRAELFNLVVKPTLGKLPESDYNFPKFTSCIVPNTYHVKVDGKFYSVPYKYVSQEVTIKSTLLSVEVFNSSLLIAKHDRVDDDVTRHITNKDHMPAKHRNFLNYNYDGLLTKAAEIGIFTKQAIVKIFERNRFEHYAICECCSLLALQKKYPLEVIEKACLTVIQSTGCPSAKSITIAASVIAAKMNSTVVKIQKPAPASSKGMMRGSSLYRHFFDNNGLNSTNSQSKVPNSSDNDEEI